jgi:hypothetical protein
MLAMYVDYEGEDRNTALRLTPERLRRRRCEPDLVVIKVALGKPSTTGLLEARGGEYRACNKSVNYDTLT